MSISPRLTAALTAVAVAGAVALPAGAAAAALQQEPQAAGAQAPAAQAPTKFECTNGFSIMHNGNWGKPTRSGYYTFVVTQPVNGPYANKTQACAAAFSYVKAYATTGNTQGWQGPELLGDTARVQNYWTGKWETEYGQFAFARNGVKYTLNRQGAPRTGAPALDAALTAASQAA